MVGCVGGLFRASIIFGFIEGREFIYGGRVVVTLVRSLRSSVD